MLVLAVSTSGRGPGGRNSRDGGHGGVGRPAAGFPCWQTRHRPANTLTCPKPNPDRAGHIGQLIMNPADGAVPLTGEM
jgi:hypothetical protein